MAGSIAEGGVSDAVHAGGVVFRTATAADNADLLRLLAHMPLGGRYAITLERAPDALAAPGPVREHRVMIARVQSTGEAVGLYERSLRMAFVNGAPQAVPYLGALRIAPSHRRRIGLVRAGFTSLRRNPLPANTVSFALTSITSDNMPARRLLTAGIDGLPLYREIGEYATLALRPARAGQDAAIAPARPEDLADVAAFLNGINARHAFAPVWTAADLDGLAAFGLLPEHILLARQGDQIRGCLALWDPRSFRQIVVRGYPAGIARFRGLLNAAGPLTRLPRLAPVGTAVAAASIALAATEKDDAGLYLRLVAQALHRAQARGLDVVFAGMMRDHPWRAALAGRYRALDYATTLYLVHEREDEAALAGLDLSAPRPELVFL